MMGCMLQKTKNLSSPTAKAQIWYFAQLPLQNKFLLSGLKDSKRSLFSLYLQLSRGSQVWGHRLLLREAAEIPWDVFAATLV